MNTNNSIIAAINTQRQLLQWGGWGSVCALAQIVAVKERDRTQHKNFA